MNQSDPDLRDALLLAKAPSHAREEVRLALIELEALENNEAATDEDAIRAVRRMNAAIRALLEKP